MNKMIRLILVSCAIGAAPLALEAAQVQKPMDCSAMAPEMQQFASQLNPANKAIFCGQFTDEQRASAMQMASSQDATGITTSPDESVQKVSGSNPQDRMPAGCPVK